MSVRDGRRRNVVVAVLLSALKVAAVAYLGMMLLVLIRQSRYVYYPDRHVEVTPKALGLKYEELLLNVGKGERINAWYVPAAAANRNGLSVIFCHGNGGDMGDLLSSVETFHMMGVDLVVFDYRGYGRSTGKPTEQGTYEDATAAWQYLTGTRGVPAKRIVLYGRSLGGAVAAELAERVNPGGLVIESAFTSASDMAVRVFPYLPARLLCRFKYDTLSRLGRIACPVLVAHGQNDTMVPYAQGRRLFAAAKEPKRFSEIVGGHNDGSIDIDPAYQAAFREFLKEVVAR
jgi:uncharacterized protein